MRRTLLPYDREYGVIVKMRAIIQSIEALSNYSDNLIGTICGPGSQDVVFTHLGHSYVDHATVETDEARKAHIFAGKYVSMASEIAFEVGINHPMSLVSTSPLIYQRIWKKIVAYRLHI